ncbi:MAG: hypothetical protein F6K65_08220 [Moorea sp. SIO3C2]|nr:hypothetical protein [Moorena sp. SIO3C2]
MRYGHAGRTAKGRWPRFRQSRRFANANSRQPSAFIQKLIAPQVACA